MNAAHFHQQCDPTSLAPTTPAAREQRWLNAADGYRLATQRFCSAAPRAYLVVAGAVGVPQGFYRRFAKFAQARGFDTLTFDYRGIALSAPPTLRGFRMDFRDWGRLDLAAVVAAAAGAAERDGLPLYLVAHSFGGHAFGLMPNHDRVRACFTFGTGAGWHGWMPRAEQIRVLALWNVVGQLLTWWKGYLPWRMAGMGEDLPLDVYRQWRQWCRYPRYFFDDPVIGADMRDTFARVRTPIAAASATDDRWSPPRSRDAFMAAYSNTHVERINLHPAELGIGPLGHMGYFRARAQPLWIDALDWLQTHDVERAPVNGPLSSATATRSTLLR